MPNSITPLSTSGEAVPEKQPLTAELPPERMVRLRRNLEEVERAHILRWKADLEWCEVAALLALRFNG